MKKLLSVTFFITHSVTVFSQQKLLTLEEAIATALGSNYDIRMVKNDSTSFAIDNNYANLAFVPRLNGSASRTWNVNAQKQELFNGTKRDTSGIRSNNLSASVNLNWTLFDGLKMFATYNKVAEYQQLGGLAVKNQVINTVAAVINNYFNIVQQKQQLRAIEEQMSINEERVKLAERKYSVGLGAKPELLQAKVDLNAQKAAQLRQLTAIAQLREQLNQLIGLPVQAMYEVTDSIPINASIEYADLQNNIENSNPALLIAKKNIDIARLVVKERKGERWPVLSFNSAYNYSRTENKVVINTFTPLFNQFRGFNYGFGVTVPLFNGMNSRRLIRQAQLDMEYQQLLYDNQSTQVDVSLSNAYKDYELQKKSLALEEENIELAKENVTIALERFRQGVSTYLELREAQKSLEDGYNRLIAARYNTKLAETELLRLKGDLVK